MAMALIAVGAVAVLVVALGLIVAPRSTVSSAIGQGSLKMLPDGWP